MGSCGVFLDRDGVVNEVNVINGVPHPPKNLLELKIFNYSKESIAKLKQADIKVFVITNQPDVSRGKASRADVEEINSYVKTELNIDDLMVCYHDDHHACACRKPSPGMIYELAKNNNIDLKNSFCVGDRWRDIEAGKAAGCKTIYIDCSYGEKKPNTTDFTVKNLKDAVNLILEHYGKYK